MKKRKIDLSLIFSLLLSIIIFLSGCAFLIFDCVGESINFYIPCMLYIFAFISFITYFVYRREGDYEFLFLTLIYVICASLLTIFMEQKDLALSSFLAVFSFLFVLSRVYKVIYLGKIYSYMWIVKSYGAILVLFLGALTSYNLYTSISYAPLVVGYFNVIFGIILSMETLIELFVSENKFKRFAMRVNKENSKLGEIEKKKRK